MDYSGSSLTLFGGIWKSYWGYKEVDDIRKIMSYGVEMFFINFPNCVVCGSLFYKDYRENIFHEYCQAMALELAGALFEVRVINQIHFDIDI